VRKAESSVGLDCRAGSKILSKILSPCQVVSEQGLFCFEDLVRE